MTGCWGEKLADAWMLPNHADKLSVLDKCYILPETIWQHIYIAAKGVSHTLELAVLGAPGSTGMPVACGWP